MTAAEFQAAGLYDPAAPDAPARLELLEWLAAQGVTLADMREAQLRWGALSGLAGDLALRAGERLTLAEVAARSGMSPERIERFDLAAAFPPVGPEERVFDPGTVAMFASFAAAEQFFGQGPLLAFIRVLGSSVARIAEAAVSLFLANVEAPIVERGASELALGATYDGGRSRRADARQQLAIGWRSARWSRARSSAMPRGLWLVMNYFVAMAEQRHARERLQR